MKIHREKTETVGTAPAGPDRLLRMLKRNSKKFKKVLTQNTAHDIISELRLNRTKQLPIKREEAYLDK